MSEAAKIERDIEKIAEMLEKNIPEEIILQVYPKELVEQVKAGAAAQEQVEDDFATDFHINEEVFVRTPIDDHFYVEIPESGKNPGISGNPKGVWMGKYDSDLRLFVRGGGISPLVIPTNVLYENAKKLAGDYENVSMDDQGHLIVESTFPDEYYEELPEGRIAVDQCVIGPELVAENFIERDTTMLWLSRGEKKVCRGSYLNNNKQPKFLKMLTMEFIGDTIEQELLEEGEELAFVSGKFIIKKK